MTQTASHSKQRERPCRCPLRAAAGLSVLRDAIRTEGSGTDESFDAVWQAEAQRTARGYAMLMTIPFRALRFPERSAGLDVLFTYQPGPFTAVYLGLTDRYDNVFVPDETGQRGVRSPGDRLAWPRTSVARQLFLKVSYLIR